MRLVFALVLGCLMTAGPALASAQDTTPGGALSAESYVALSADYEAQMSFGGFRSYLERVRDEEPDLYSLLDAELDPLEERELIADVVFWTGAVLSAGALVSAIPVYEELGVDASIGFIAAGSGVLLIALIVQAILRPGHDDLMGLIDTHDRRLGRR